MPLLDPNMLADPTSSDDVLGGFLDYLAETGTEPYDHQEQAILELFVNPHPQIGESASLSPN